MLSSLRAAQQDCMNRFLDLQYDSIRYLDRDVKDGTRSGSNSSTIGISKMKRLE